jgi:hypothetical protein
MCRVEGWEVAQLITIPSLRREERREGNMVSSAKSSKANTKMVILPMNSLVAIGEN